MNLIKTGVFNNYRVIFKHGPLIQRILMANELMMAKSLSDHNRLLVMRFELKFPKGYSAIILGFLYPADFSSISRAIFFVSVLVACLCIQVKRTEKGV